MSYVEDEDGKENKKGNKRNEEKEEWSEIAQYQEPTPAIQRSRKKEGEKEMDLKKEGSPFCMSYWGNLCVPRPDFVNTGTYWKIKSSRRGQVTTLDLAFPIDLPTIADGCRGKFTGGSSPHLWLSGHLSTVSWGILFGELYNYELVRGQWR